MPLTIGAAHESESTQIVLPVMFSDKSSSRSRSMAFPSPARMRSMILVVHAVPSRHCVHWAHDSCAQCTQCREGTAWTTKIMERILAGEGKMQDLDLLLDLSENMTGKTICVLSDSCAAPVVSGIKKFKNEFEDYIAGKRQPVMVA